MTWTAIIVSIVIGLAINEYADVAPWGARKLVRRAARRMYADNAKRAEIRAEEWAAVIEDRPGKLFKLTSALCYSVAAEFVAVRRQYRSGSPTWESAMRYALDVIMSPGVLMDIAIARMNRWMSCVVIMLTFYWPVLLIAFLALSEGSDTSHASHDTSLPSLTSIAIWVLGLPALAILTALYMRVMCHVVMLLVGEGDRRRRKEIIASVTNEIRPAGLKR